MQAMYQLIEGPKISVIHEYLYGVLNKGYAFDNSEQSFLLSKIPHHFFKLETIHTTDSQVIRASMVPTTKIKNIVKI